MTEEARLFEKRISELSGLIDDHLRGGSLDEGNAGVFDRLIEAWLAEELVRLDGAVADEVRSRAARAGVRRQHTHTVEQRQNAATRRDETVRDVELEASLAAARRRTERREARINVTKQQLDAAATRLETAETLLLGLPLSELRAAATPRPPLLPPRSGTAPAPPEPDGSPAGQPIHEPDGRDDDLEDRDQEVA